MESKLTYYKSAWFNYQWSLLYEFEIVGFEEWHLDESHILSSIINSKILTERISHDEIDKENFQVSTEGIKRPFKFNKIEVSDFEKYCNYIDYNKIITDFSNEDDWGDDKEDFRSLVIRTDYLIRERTNFKNGFWLLRRDNLSRQKDKLDEINWIYIYWFLIVEIDRTNKIIRTIDLGYD